MSLINALSGAVTRHKAIARDLIYSSEISVTIETKVERESALTGASMFADLDNEDSSEPNGPYKTIWVDADAARIGTGSREGNLVSRYSTADIVAKFWLEDVLIDTADAYSETLFDKAYKVVYNARDYQVLGYDRYGLGTTTPYIIAVALRGDFDG